MTDGHVLWKCKCGAQLGAVVRSASNVLRLKVFTPATRSVDEFVVGQRVQTAMVEMQGAGKVKCVFCGRVRSWHAAEEITKEFLQRREGE